MRIYSGYPNTRIFSGLFFRLTSLRPANNSKALPRRTRLASRKNISRQIFGFPSILSILKSVLMISALGLLAPATTANAKLEGVFSDWTVHSKTDGGDKICFALAKPKSKTPSTVDHGDIYFMVANWKSGAAKEQPSLITGYMLKAQIPPSARIGRAKIPMFADKNEAFVENDADEKKLVRSMRGVPPCASMRCRPEVRKSPMSFPYAV